jgi:hypothetical protein
MRVYYILRMRYCNNVNRNVPCAWYRVTYFEKYKMKITENISLENVKYKV